MQENSSVATFCRVEKNYNPFLRRKKQEETKNGYYLYETIT